MALRADLQDKMDFRTRILCAVALAVSFPAASAVLSPQMWPYLQVYPPVNETDGRTPIFFALVLSFGGDFTSIGALPGIQIALDYINDESSILPGYSLHYTLTDSQCNHSIAFDTFYKEINFPPTKLGWIGSGCSVATEPTAELTQYYNITQVSCVSSSPELRNRPRFRYYFQLLATEVVNAQGFFGIINHFGWKRVGIISQDENLFTETVNALKQSLNKISVDYVEKRFRSDEGISGISAPLFEPGIRIFVLTMYDLHARDILCEAYRGGLRYPKYMFITYGWYTDDWLEQSNDNCTPDELASVLPYTLGSYVRDFPVDEDLTTETGLDVSQFKSQYFEVASREINEQIDLVNYTNVSGDPFEYSYHCHEGTLAFAYALNLTIADLAENSTLNSEAADLSDLPDGDIFTIDNFTYANSAVVSRMFKHLQETDFLGITGNDVRFDAQGTRDLKIVSIVQYQNNDKGQLNRIEVAMVTEDNSTFVPFSNLLFPEGVPNDGVPINEVVTVSVALTAIYVILAVAGLLFAIACLSFTIIFRRKKLIRLSSPNLNYIIGLGAIILYLNVISFVIPTTDQDFVSVLCNINPWLTSLGYSLCYGTILIKMIRVWIIFSRPFGLKAPLLKDYAMLLFVLSLVVIDVLILGIYTVNEGVSGNLGVKLTPNREMREEIIGPTEEIHLKFLYVCESDGQDALYGVLYGYKGLLTLFALLLAFRIRKVKVKGLDDSKYIAASIYVTSIVLAVIIVSTYTLMDYVNVYPAVVGMGFLLGTTMILALVFIPRMVGFYRDPEGDKITFMSTVTQQSDKEVVELRLRVSELEKSLKQRASFAVADSHHSDGAVDDCRGYTLEVASNYQMEGQQSSSSDDVKIVHYSKKNSNGDMHTF